MKTFSFLFSFFIFTGIALGASCIDEDKDGYFVYSGCIEIGDTGCQDNWSDIKKEKECSDIQFKKGIEPEVCDTKIIDEDSGLYDISKVEGPLNGRNFNKGQSDVPKNGLDENCDGLDGNDMFGDSDQSVSDVVVKITSFLSTIAMGISVIVFIYGGIMYSSAAGNDEKIATARKAMIGAVIGAIIAFFAPQIISFIVSAIS